MRDSISDVKIFGYDQFTGDANSTAAKKQGFKGILFAGEVSVAPTTALKLEESDDNVTFTDVPADLQYGDLGVVAVGTFKAGYTGYKHYVRIADTGGTAVVDVLTVGRHPDYEPQA